MFEEACRQNKAEDVSTMLNHCRPVPVEIRTKKSESALMLACANGAKEVCQVLIDNYCDLEARDLQEKTALFYAAEKGHLDCLKFLIEHKADANARDLKGRKPIDLAYSYDKKYCVHYLIDKTSDVKEEDFKMQAICSRKEAHSMDTTDQESDSNCSKSEEDCDFQQDSDYEEVSKDFGRQPLESKSQKQGYKGN
jgi:ankyrin repeat protein